MSLALWIGFLFAAIVIAVSPGPGAALTMSTGLRHGYVGTLPAIAGLQAALLIQLTIVALGLGAVLAASSTAFECIKLAGAAYLVWLGILKWRSAKDPERLDDGWRSGLFRQGLLVNLTNPKAIIFMAALTPQFIDPNQPQWPQFLIIALTMCAVDTLVMSGYALLASRLRDGWLTAAARRGQNRVFGALFVAAGLLLATSGRS